MEKLVEMALKNDELQEQNSQLEEHIVQNDLEIENGK